MSEERHDSPASTGGLIVKYLRLCLRCLAWLVAVIGYGVAAFMIAIPIVIFTLAVYTKAAEVGAWTSLKQIGLWVLAVIVFVGLIGLWGYCTQITVGRTRGWK